MEEIVVHGHIASQPSRSVILFCELSKLKYRLQEVNLPAGEMSRKSFKPLNPHREIPVVVCQGYNLWESGAIIQYLADKFNVDNQYYPKNAEIRGRILAYLHWHHENVRRPIYTFIKKKVLFPIMLGKPEITLEKENKLREKIFGVCRDLEWVLEETGFVARTQQVTIADIFAFNEIVSGHYVGIQISGFSRLSKWFETIAKIPEVKKVCDSVLNEFRLVNGSPKL